LIATSVVFDAVYIPGGEVSVASLTEEADALHFVEEAYKHCKPIAADAAALEFLNYTYIANKMDEEGYDANTDGLIIGTGKTNISKSFIEAMKQHRFWERESKGKIPA
jgi:catalase